jgi:3'-5' exoribonuclease
MARARGTPTPLREIAPGEPAVFFALLTQKTAHSTRDGKRFLTCHFQDAGRRVSTAIWSDAPLFAECDAEWTPGTAYKIQGTYAEHEKYGPQIDILKIRPVKPEDAADGYREADLIERSRHDSAAMFADLRNLLEAEITDEPLRRLTLSLLDTHREALLVLPASPQKFYPYPGGWLEHTLSVTRLCRDLTTHFAAQFPDLKPPLNRDVLLAGAALHDLGRAVELTPGAPGTPPEPTVAGRLFGHVLLGRDLVRDAAREVPGLHPDRLTLLEHLVTSHLALPEWGSPRLPAAVEVLILHHADDLDAKVEMYARVLSRDRAAGPFTDRDPNLGKQLWKGREV